MPTGEDDAVLTRAGADRGYKLCRCCICLTVARCTPRFDFYESEDVGDMLIGECCVYVEKKNRRIHPSLLSPGGAA